MKNHELLENAELIDVKYEKRVCKNVDGSDADGLYNVWIILDNEAQYNSYTTEMVKSVILAFRKASMDSSVVAVVFTGAGNKAFCTGGNVKEYAEYYAGRPDEYYKYMWLFNEMVTSILTCDKPVVCRVNGMRIGGGQEIGMACDFSISSDLAKFGQAGPKHGSAPDGGSTDFLPLFVGIEESMFSCTVCEPWTAHKAQRLGLLTDVVPALKVNGEFIANPTTNTSSWVDEQGKIIYGESKTGEAFADGKAVLKSGEVSLEKLDARLEELLTKLMLTMPSCLSKTIQSLRKHKLVHWDKNKESNRSWLAGNMMTEAKLGFRSFNEGPRNNRETDFVKLRQRLANGEKWGDDFINSMIPK
ncbi:MAG: 6-oxocyclohex-1-ene-1-carbonyl-CoA hydratase [Proteobacteria bacterium]|nr:6-oxocyclohex-1-ene-1-carbonyl-CoA hydratase [Pseudomonadota bacterium]